jgi:hypothetical protein
MKKLYNYDFLNILGFNEPMKIYQYFLPYVGLISIGSVEQLVQSPSD